MRSLRVLPISAKIVAELRWGKAMELETYQDSTTGVNSDADTIGGASNRLREEALHPAEYSPPNNGPCRLPEASNTSFVPDIIESYTRCRQEGSVLESTLDEIYWNLRHEKSFGSEGFKRLIENRFAVAHLHNKRQLDFIIMELNFGIKLMNSDYGLNWYKKTDPSTGNQLLRIDLHDNSKGGSVLDSLAVTLPKAKA